MDYCLVAEGGEGAVGVEAEDAAGGDGGVVEGGMVGEAEVDALFQGGVNVGIGGGGRTARKICGSADQGATKLVKHLLTKSKLGDAYADGAVGGWKVIRYGDCKHIDGQNDGSRPRAVEEQLADLGWDMRCKHLLICKDKHGLAMVALFDGVDAFYGVSVGGIATDSPNGIGRIYNHAARTERFQCGFYVLLVVSHSFLQPAKVQIIIDIHK